MLSAPTQPLHQRNPLKDWTSMWNSRTWDKYGNIKHDTPHSLNLRTNSGADWQAAVMAGGTNKGQSGTATGIAATSLTDTGGAFPTTGGGPSGTGNVVGYQGKIVVAFGSTAGKVYGVVTLNTSTVLTIDKWQDPATPGTTASTPTGTISYVILPGNAPLMYLALSNSAVGTATDVTLGGEFTNASNPGLQRALYDTYTHSNAGTSVQLAKLYTCGATTSTINSGAITAASWDGSVTDKGVMAFEFSETSPPTLVLNDTVNQKVLVNY